MDAQEIQNFILKKNDEINAANNNAGLALRVTTEIKTGIDGLGRKFDDLKKEFISLREYDEDKKELKKEIDELKQLLRDEHAERDKQKADFALMREEFNGKLKYYAGIAAAVVFALGIILK